jgi:beta-lactamase class A
MALKLMLVGVVFSLTAHAAPPASQPAAKFVITYDSPIDAGLQSRLEQIDKDSRARFGITDAQTAVGLCDLTSGRLAMLRPDHEEYAASVAKIAILLAYFEMHPEAAEHLDPTVRHELGLMIKVSSNEMASKYSHELGLPAIYQVIQKYHFYDEKHGGGIWMGKHYGKDPERHGSPVGDNSHAATVRQLLRFYLMLEQGELVSPGASRTMREIFASPEIAHDENKFLRGLKGRQLEVIRKSGTWEDWLHDTAVVTGPGRRYVLVALTKHPKGDEYLEAIAPLVDDVMQGK